MKCSKCGKEMRKGYVFSSKDGAFSFANEVPGVFENAKNADGFVEITKLKPGHRTRVEANCCEECRKIVIITKSDKTLKPRAGTGPRYEPSWRFILKNGWKKQNSREIYLT